MKKVLVISGSPRKGGNSDLLCDEFIRGAKQNNNVVTKISLRDKKINYCIGCGVCNSTHKCVQNDEMAQILDLMIDSDVIVMATPVYFYTMDGQMKTFIDRTVPRYTEISNKEFYFIVTSADQSRGSLARTIEGFRGFTDGCLNNPIEKGIIYGTGVWDKGEVNGTDFIRQAYEMGVNV